MVWLFIVHNVPDTNETKDILKMFRLFNDNDDGKMSKDELYNALIKYFDKSDIDKEIDDLFFLLDGSNKCYIEYEEFLGACMDKNKLLCEEHLTYAFNYFDKSNKGKISFDNIKIYFVDEKTNEDVFRNIFDEIDTNKDGEIDYSEFKNMMFGY
jgi:calcium-dependent protein kinase